jgi:hypothetical protein
VFEEFLNSKTDKISLLTAFESVNAWLSLIQTLLTRFEFQWQYRSFVAWKTQLEAALLSKEPEKIIGPLKTIRTMLWFLRLSWQHDVHRNCPNMQALLEHIVAKNQL